MSSDNGEWTKVGAGGKTVRIEVFTPLPTDALKDPLEGLGKSWGSDSEEEEATPPGAAESADEGAAPLGAAESVDEGAAPPGAAESADEEADAQELKALTMAQKLRSEAKQVRLKFEEAKAEADELRKKHEKAEAKADELHKVLQKTNLEYGKWIKVLSDAHSDTSDPIQTWTVGNTTINGGVPTVIRPQVLSGDTATGSGNVRTNSTARLRDDTTTQRLSRSRNPGWFDKFGELRVPERDCLSGQDCYKWKNGMCPYNHGCEKCSDGGYCKLMCCSKDHPKGRAKFVLYGNQKA